MQIRRVILKKVRNFGDFDHSLVDAWRGEIPSALLLMGPNGSGKSTLLSVIADLWRVFEIVLRGEDELPLAHPSLTASLLLARAELAAMEIVGLDSSPLWLFAGAKAACQAFVASQPDSHRSGVFYYSDRGTAQLQAYGYARPGMTRMEEPAQLPEWEQGWAQRLTENLLGKRQDLSNIVYLESENRQVLPLSEKFNVLPETEEFRWLARYEPTASRKGSLQNYLYNLKVVDESAFEAIVSQVNAFLRGKRLNGFDRRTGSLLVQIEGGDTHPIEELSSGEKQVLLMLALVTRWLRPGGIVLLDEPDLHLHVSLTTAFVSHLRRLVEGQSGQLILASHEPQLWQDFTESHTLRLGNITELERRP